MEYGWWDAVGGKIPWRTVTPWHAEGSTGALTSAIFSLTLFVPSVVYWEAPRVTQMSDQLPVQREGVHAAAMWG